MNPIVEKVYQIGIIPVIAFNSVAQLRRFCAMYTSSYAKHCAC